MRRKRQEGRSWAGKKGNVEEEVGRGGSSLEYLEREDIKKRRVQSMGRDRKGRV